VQVNPIPDQAGNSSDELADYGEEDHPIMQQMLGPQHFMMHESDSDDELNNHEDTGSGDQGSNDFI
jgi:hypothetical protein